MESYPPTYESSGERQQAVQEAWKNFLAEFELPETRLDLEPILNTPRSLPMALANRISVTKKSGTFGEMEAKEAVRGFIERTRGILFGDPKNSSLGINDLTLDSFIDDGKFYRLHYRQVTYPFPIASGYGDLSLTVSKNGMLLQWSSRIIPKLDLPTRPEIKSEELIEKLVNREFQYTTIAGQTQSYRVSKREEISVKEPVVYPKPEGNKLSIHLALPVDVGSGMTWTVYFDAINGRELGVKQNFVS